MEIPAIVGGGLVVIGAGLGIGRIGGSALEAMARQPELTGKIQTVMLIAAALIEGQTINLNDEESLDDFVENESFNDINIDADRQHTLELEEIIQLKVLQKQFR